VCDSLGQLEAAQWLLVAYRADDPHEPSSMPCRAAAARQSSAGSFTSIGDAPLAPSCCCWALPWRAHHPCRPLRKTEACAKSQRDLRSTPRYDSGTHASGVCATVWSDVACRQMPGAGVGLQCFMREKDAGFGKRFLLNPLLKSSVHDLQGRARPKSQQSMSQAKKQPRRAKIASRASKDSICTRD